MPDYIEAAIKLGLPVMLISWWVYSNLYRKKLLDKSSNRKETKQAVKNYRKELKHAEKVKKATSQENVTLTYDEGDNAKNDFWVTKWLRFGGGFYGLCAIWTLIVLEVQGLVQLILNLPSFMESYSVGVFGLIYLFLKNQIKNFTESISWVVNWGGGFNLLWILLAYFGYMGGMQLAKRWDARDLSKQLFKRQWNRRE